MNPTYKWSVEDHQNSYHEVFADFKELLKNQRMDPVNYRTYNSMGIFSTIIPYLKKKFPHHIMQSLIKRRVMQQRGSVAKPAIKMDQLEVSKFITMHGHVSEPSLHHGFEDPVNVSFIV